MVVFEDYCIGCMGDHIPYIPLTLLCYCSYTCVSFKYINVDIVCIMIHNVSLSSL